MHSFLPLLLAILLAGCGTPALRVVLVAGPNDHCGTSPCHRYVEDLQALQSALENPENVPRAKAELYIGERPPMSVLRNADVLVVHSSADRKEGEWHALFPTLPETEPYAMETVAYLSEVDREMRRGMGLVSLHYTNWVDHPRGRAYYADWLGGYFRRDTSKVKADLQAEGSVAPVTARPSNGTNHPVLAGVSPWTAKSEWYYRIVFPPGSGRLTPLLTADLPLNDPQPETVAWAWERPGGGRAVGFTEGHSPTHMYLENYRRFLLNAIVWAAGREVPAGGIESSLSEPTRIP